MKSKVTLFFLLFAFGLHAQFVTIDATFTNRTYVGSNFVAQGATARWTNTPLNNSSWLTTNSAAGSATNFQRFFAINYPRFRAVMTNATNVTISGFGLQISGTEGYAVLTTNIPTSTNNLFVTVPFDNQYATNRTNMADSLAYGIETYVRTNPFTQRTNGLLQNYSTLTHTQRMANKLATNFVLQGGSSTNHFGTNWQSLHATNVAAGKLTATSGQLDGVLVTNAADVTATSGRIGVLQVFTSAVITNLSAPGVGADSLQVGSGAGAVGSGSIAIGNGAFASNSFSVAIGKDTSATEDYALALGTTSEAVAPLATAVGIGAYAAAIKASAFGNSASSIYSNSTAVGAGAQTTTTNQVRLGTSAEHVSIPGRLEADLDARLSSITNSRLSSAIRSDEGAYANMTGGSNNIALISVKPWTRLSGHVSACNLNSLRQGALGSGDGMEMDGREAGIINGGSFDVTLIDTLSDGFETLSTNEMDLAGVNITLAPKDRAWFRYRLASARWELVWPKPPTNLVVKTTGDFSGANTTNVVSFNAQQIQRMTNAMTTNATFIVSNVVAGSEIHVYLTGANGGVIASNYTFTVRTNSLPTASRITWLSSTNGTYDVAVSSNKWGVVKFTAPFTTNIFARYEEGP